MHVSKKTIEKLDTGLFRCEVLVNGKRQGIIVENLNEHSIIIEGDKFNKVYREKDAAIEAACASKCCKIGKHLYPRFIATCPG